MAQHLITTAKQIDGTLRYIYAQDEIHAQKAARILRDDPAMIDHLNGIEGIRITVRDSAVSVT